MNIIYRMFVYDFLYVMADQLIKKYNPCGIETSRSGQVTCIGYANGYSPCCDNCEYLSSTGCTITCLGCKLGLCRETHIAHPDLSARFLTMASIIDSPIGALYYNIRSIRTPRQAIYDLLRRLGFNRHRTITKRR